MRYYRCLQPRLLLWGDRKWNSPRLLASQTTTAATTTTTTLVIIIILVQTWPHSPVAAIRILPLGADLRERVPIEQWATSCCMYSEELSANTGARTHIFVYTNHSANILYKEELWTPSPTPPAISSCLIHAHSHSHSHSLLNTNKVVDISFVYVCMCQVWLYSIMSSYPISLMFCTYAVYIYKCTYVNVWNNDCTTILKKNS